MTTDDAAALELHGIVKTFPGQRALDGVDFTVARGEIHALLGHNGSGKSTLIKVLSGFHQPDTGHCSVAGSRLRFGDGVAVSRAGVRIIHQDIGLVDELSVLENLRLGVGTYRAGTLGAIRWRDERAAARARLDDLGLGHIDPAAEVAGLSAVERTEVAIARAIDDPDAIRVLVLDEASAALPEEQVQHLFRLVRTLAARGVGVVYVTHRLEEVVDLADRVTVLRDGAVVLQESVSALTREDLARVIADSEVEAVHTSDRAAGRTTGAPVLELAGVVAGRELAGASLTLREGEVLGVAGLAGSGVHEVVRLLQGRSALRSGAVLVGGAPVPRPGVRSLRRLGVAVLPGERDQKRITGMTLAENITIADLSPYWRGGRFRHRAERADAVALVERYRIRPPDVQRPIELLSGGNAQKAYVARLLRTAPRVLVMEEPTHGVDVGGTAEILRLLVEAARSEGTAVLLCSSDTDDLAATCDRVLVLRDGVVADELTDKEITRERIVELCYAAG
ncbi:sugar ABC transporter ATP-binding protein [Pimelobacter simplex]|uniref:sugar ABC transporter ATP-binding protein n=1 Tax=Nocardioides simplex TaxID=2045 RepID=UPI003AAA73F8